MRFVYPTTILCGIAVTVLSAPINSDGGLIARTERESTAAVKVPNPLDIAPAAAKESRDRSLSTSLESGRKNKRTGHSVGYPRYYEDSSKTKRQFGYDDYDDLAIAKRQDSFGYSDYDEENKKNKRMGFGNDH
ncbi:conserved hypothetical protein [Histoplasma capsulatum var. duboisii H88]|uniref:Uncharacterized protein n=2 Tax=Ajellomyces capsulatus TaxID=5037 RepID=F0UG50_AJEC8|nr:conserved hypothetical protein [Histoplasma capsulatum H143]EGC44256.1 conserved hypothetical protein [Histoplasma capsulatum var. duboisii H88]QSS55039.1 hypothetical protein I7I53_02802 [Histoplasma capsulatum var. duboisii H88]